MIVRTFPSHSPNPEGEQYAQYCKYQLIKFKPWKDHLCNAWGGGEDRDETCIAAYHTFLQTEDGRLLIPHFARDLAKAQQYVQLTNEIDNEIEESLHDTQQEEWMLLCQHHHRLTMHTDSTSDGVDWAANARLLSPDVLRDCPTWLNSRRKKSKIIQIHLGIVNFLPLMFHPPMQNND